MNRDEILAEIKRASTGKGAAGPGLGSIRGRMEDVARLADTYLDSEAGDAQYLAEALQSAMARFAAMIRVAQR